LRDIEFKAADGFPLRGNLFEGTGNGPAILISSAAAVPNTIYRHFAGRLVDLGASHVLTYDYRGVAKSAVPRHWKDRLNLKDWGVLDFPAALDELKRIAGPRPIVGIGHSYGGVALGLSNRASELERYTMLASLSGYYRNTAQPCAMYAKMNLLGVPLTIPFGKLPRWGGLGEAVPGTIFRDWARWCRNPNFLFADPAVPEARHFQSQYHCCRWGSPTMSGVRQERWKTCFRAFATRLCMRCGIPLPSQTAHRSVISAFSASTRRQYCGQQSLTGCCMQKFLKVRRCAEKCAQPSLGEFVDVASVNFRHLDKGCTSLDEQLGEQTRLADAEHHRTLMGRCPAILVNWRVEILRFLHEAAKARFAMFNQEPLHEASR
jgi:predicted alpha/beta hydrolase